MYCVLGVWGVSDSLQSPKWNINISNNVKVLLSPCLTPLRVFSCNSYLHDIHLWTCEQYGPQTVFLNMHRESAMLSFTSPCFIWHHGINCQGDAFSSWLSPCKAILIIDIPKEVFLQSMGILIALHFLPFPHQDYSAQYCPEGQQMLAFLSTRYTAPLSQWFEARAPTSGLLLFCIILIKV